MTADRQSMCANLGKRPGPLTKRYTPPPDTPSRLRRHGTLGRRATYIRLYVHVQLYARRVLQYVLLTVSPTERDGAFTFIDQ